MKIIDEAIRLAGGAAAVAAALNMSSWGVRKWVHDGIPPKHVIWLARQTGWRVRPHDISPTLYPHPRDGMPRRASTEQRATA